MLAGPAAANRRRRKSKEYFVLRSTRLSFICHGATFSSYQGAFPIDEPLADSVADHVQTVAGSIRPSEKVLVSPALRARQTAKALFLDAIPDERLKDLDYGQWAGQSLLELQRVSPGSVALWMSDPTHAPHGGESIAELVARVSQLLDAHKTVGGHIVAVTHAAVIRGAILSLLNAPLSSFWMIDIEPLTVTEFSSDGRRFSLRSSGRPLIP